MPEIHRSSGLKQTDALHPPATADLRAESADMLSAARNSFQPWAWIATGGAVHGADEIGIAPDRLGARYGRFDLG